MNTIVTSKYIHIFLFVFIVYSGAIHNQMNIIRQYCAIYLFTIGLCLLINKKYKSSILFFILMCFTHSSSIILVPIIFIINLFIIKSQSIKFLYAMVILAFIFSFMLKIEYIAHIFPFFDQYVGYLKGDRIEDVSVINRLTKYINIPLFVCSIYLYNKMRLNDYQKKMFKLGIFAFSFKLSLISFFIVGRIGLYFDILACVPLCFLLINFIQRKQKIKFYLTISYLLVPYMLKVTLFATQEYLYNSYFFNF